MFDKSFEIVEIHSRASRYSDMQIGDTVFFEKEGLAFVLIEVAFAEEKLVTYIAQCICSANSSYEIGYQYPFAWDYNKSVPEFVKIIRGSNIVKTFSNEMP